MRGVGRAGDRVIDDCAGVNDGVDVGGPGSGTDVKGGFEVGGVGGEVVSGDEDGGVVTFPGRDVDEVDAYTMKGKGRMSVSLLSTRQV